MKDIRKYKVKMYGKNKKKLTTYEFKANNRVNLIKNIERKYKGHTISSINNIPSYSKKKKKR